MNNLEDLLTFLENELENVKRQQLFLPEGTLAKSNREGKTYYQRDYVENDRRRRQTISNNRKLLNDMARKEYLKEQKKVLEADIKLIKRIATKYVEPNPDNILPLLKEKYKNIPIEYFFEEYDVNQWALEAFEQSDYKIEEKRHITTRGLQVRSKSEMLIAERLYHHQVAFRYEEVIHVGNKKYIPDFTIMCNNGNLFYWEHCGLPDNQSYMFKFKSKLEDYESIGIVPWRNLIVTYEEEGFNLEIIDSEIRNKILSKF